jgi:hypothetical protein
LAAGGGGRCIDPSIGRCWLFGFAADFQLRQSAEFGVLARKESEHLIEAVQPELFVEVGRFDGHGSDYRPANATDLSNIGQLSALTL